MNVSLESLLWKPDEEKLADRLVYYDLEGRRFEKGASSDLIDEALKLFGGKVKAVGRSTGGLVIAEPYQLIVYGDPAVEGQSDVRIRVRFRDFKRGPGGKVESAEYVTHTKTVLPADLKEPFSYRCAGPFAQRFIMDFGQGIVPVHVFHYRPDPAGGTIAYFLEAGELERVVNGPRGSRTTVQVYRTERDVVRYAPEDPERGPIEYDLAAANYRRQIAEKQIIVPEALRVGTPTPMIAGLPVEEIQRALIRTLQARPQAAEPLCFTLDEEDGLKPFGIYEVEG